jgi:hypothetical protein
VNSKNYIGKKGMLYKYISKLPLHLMPCVIGRRGTASKTRRPSEIGITIIPALNISSVIHAITSKSTIRSAKLYLQKVKYSKLETRFKFRNNAGQTLIKIVCT